VSPLENTLAVVLLLIFVTGVLPRWQKKSRTLMMEPVLTPPMNMRKTSDYQQKTVNSTPINGTVKTMSKRSSPNIHCKWCDTTFTRLDWMTKKICDNPNCNCPEVKKAMRAATTAINKAMDSSKNEITVKEYVIPDNYDEALGEHQLMIECPPVMVIDIKPNKG